MTSRKALSQECTASFRSLRVIKIRSSLLFLNFFLIVLALYALKPASRSLFIESLGADRLPYVWIGTAVVMGMAIAYYHRIVKYYDRYHVVLGTCLLFSALLIGFRMLLIHPTEMSAAALYVFVDILGVVLVEQFWSLTNSIYSTEEGKRWYGIIGTGGLAGGVVGGAFAAFLIKRTALQTPDLLLVAVAVIGALFGVTWLLGHLGIYCESEKPVDLSHTLTGWRELASSRYLVLIAAVLLLAQIASTLVEFQFLKTVEEAYTDREARTAFLSMFFSVMGLISIVVNLFFTPLVHRYFGVIAGLMVQPLMIGICSWGFLFHPGLAMGGATKVSDRGLSYSINRASRELLYVPVDPVIIYQAKAWIDMFGYRLFKVFSSFLILLVTQWLPIRLGLGQMSWLTLGICGLWVAAIIVLRADYQSFFQRSQG